MNNAKQAAIDQTRFEGIQGAPQRNPRWVEYGNDAELQARVQEIDALQPNELPGSALLDKAMENNWPPSRLRNELDQYEAYHEEGINPSDPPEFQEQRDAPARPPLERRSDDEVEGDHRHGRRRDGAQREDAPELAPAHHLRPRHKYKPRRPPSCRTRHLRSRAPASLPI